jgi:vacuolar-type H+-ATPase subunit E/Vma4
VAIDDIVARIAQDAEAEAAAIVAEAEGDAARLTGDARSRAADEAARVVARGRTVAERDAATLVANARLAARDAMLAARLELDGEALAKAEAALVALPDAEYAALVARGVAASAAEGDRLLVGTADGARLRAGLPGALKAAGAPVLEIGDGPADVEHGVIVQGERVRVEVSPAAMIAEQRDEMLAIADTALFGAEE